MTDPTALFKISYGLYLIGAKDEVKENACINNTLIQISSEPLRCLVAMNKSSYTHDLIKKTGLLSVSVIDQRAELSFFNHFGTQSGRNVDKFFEYPPEICSNGCPVLTEGITAHLAGKVWQEIDATTHTLFLFDVTEAQVLSDFPPMTYAQYRSLKNQGGFVSDETKVAAKYVCSVCHYEYDGEIPFEDLPDDYQCPICGVGKELFVKV